MSVLMMDLDSLKSINDMFGHETGDEALRCFSRTILQNIREVDTAARLGGDEFAILLVDTDVDSGAAALGRLHMAILGEIRRHGWSVTLSMGAVTSHVLPSSAGPMLQRADELMYAAKGLGSPRVHMVIAEVREGRLVDVEAGRASHQPGRGE